MDFNLKNKIEGSTIVEITVALVVVSIVLLISMMTYINVLKTTKYNTKYRAIVVANNIEEVIKEKQVDFIEEMDNLLVEVYFVPYKNEQELLFQNILVKEKSGRLIYENKKIVLKNEESAIF